MRRVVELLAPAGNMTCLHAAVQSGADAVYLGVDRFNARRGADNFTLETLPKACEYAHLRGVKIYLTVNTVILPSETEAAIELVRQAYRCGVDAFIVQDIGLAGEIHRTLPKAEIHISTQMNTHNIAGLEAALCLGAQRVTLARELSYAEIALLSDAADQMGMEIEIFAHGAICICYSGQCFMSSLIGGRSANRGMCAQACRLPYELNNRAQRKPLDAPGDHLLSPKDLCTVEVIPELIACGVSSLKIEGRMKSPEYVSAVVGIYRAVLDRTLAWLDERESGRTVDGCIGDDCSQGAENIGDCQQSVTSDEENFAQTCEISAPWRHLNVPETVRPSQEELRILNEAFSRGFTTAYLTHDDGNQMMSFGRPNNRGIFVGRVSGIRDGDVLLEADCKLAAGDVVEFWTNRGHFAHVVDQISRDERGIYHLKVNRNVGKGDRVFRVRSASATFVDNALLPRVPVSGRIRAYVGTPLAFELCVSAGPHRGVCVEVEGSVVEPARTKAITEAEIRDHIDRFGNEPFELSALDVEMSEGIGMGFSALHKVRALACTRLAEGLVGTTHDRKLPKLQTSSKQSQKGALFGNCCEVVVWATNAACARAAKKAHVDRIVVPALHFKRGESLIAGQLSSTVAQAGYPKNVEIALPTVDHELIRATRETRFNFDPWRYVKSGDRVIAENWGQVIRAIDQGAVVEAGPHIPALNAWAVRELAQAGATRVWLSPELTLGQIQQIAEEVDIPLGLTVSGAQELMVTEHCMLMSQGPCDRNCTECVRRKSPHYLKDRKGFEMPVVTDCTGRSHIYNAVPLDVVHLLPDLIAAGVTAIMIDATMMTVEETKKACARAVRARDIALRDGNAVAKLPKATTGHLFRGIS